MRLFLKIALMSFFIAAAQAAEPAYEGDKDSEACTPSSFINKSYLSCVVCGLKKAGRPAPDEHFVALLGLLVRENTALFEDEVNPKQKTNESRRSIVLNKGKEEKSSKGPVEFTARAQMQKNTLQMLLSSGYCTQGKIKSKVKNTDYSNFVERMKSDQHPVSDANKKIRQKAVQELGFSDWDNAREQLLYNTKGSSFFALPFEEQKEFYKNKRTSALNNSEDSPRTDSDITNCLKDIEQNYAPAYSSAEDTYATCKVVYDECKIASIPDSDEQIYYDKEKKQRVGGDWCAKKYKPETPVLAKKPNDITAPAAGINGDKTGPAAKEKLAPVEDKSFKSLGETYEQGGLIHGREGTIDPSKVVRTKDGFFIPNSAIQRKQPASAPVAPAESSPAPKVEVKGTQKPADIPPK